MTSVPTPVPFNSSPLLPLELIRRQIWMLLIVADYFAVPRRPGVVAFLIAAEKLPIENFAKNVIEI